MDNNNLLLMTGMQTTKIMYVGPKAVKLDTVTGRHPQMRFPRHVEVETPLIIAQALLGFDCFVPVTESALEAIKQQEELAREQELKAAELAAALKLEEEELANTTIINDGETIDVAKLTFAEIETLCLGLELDVVREEGEPKEVLASRVRKAFDEQNKAND